MKKFLSYFGILLLILVVAIPTYAPSIAFPEGYRAYITCKDNVCDRGYVLNVVNANLPQQVNVNWLDNRDKILYNKIINDFNLEKKNNSYIIMSDKNCVENEIKTHDIEKEIVFTKEPIFVFPNKSEHKKTCQVVRKNKEEKKFKELCHMDVIATNNNTFKFETYFRYLIYKMA